jgi:hypothetical protein
VVVTLSHCGVPAQQGASRPPHGTHEPLTHAKPVPHAAPDVQHAWPLPPQLLHEPPEHTSDAVPLQLPPAQHGCVLPPQSRHVPPMHAVVAVRQLPAPQHDWPD